MPINFTSTDKAGKFAKVLVYGEAGVGKTRLCGTIPNNVIISAEGGLLSLADKSIPVIAITTPADAFEALAWVKGSAEANQFETVSLDSLTDIAEVLLTAYKREFVDARQAYGKLSDDMGDLIRQFRDLPNKNIYMTAQLGKLKDELTGLISYSPNMPGNNLKTACPYFFDEVLCLRIGEDELKQKFRYLQTQPDFQFTAKDRSGKLAFHEYPDLLNIFTKMLA